MRQQDETDQDPGKGPGEYASVGKHGGDIEPSDELVVLIRSRAVSSAVSKVAEWKFEFDVVIGQKI